MEPLLKKPRTRVLADKLSLNGLTSSSEIMYEGVHHAKDTVTKYRQYMSLTFLRADLRIKSLRMHLPDESPSNLQKLWRLLQTLA